jgi:hypothetical protein
MVTWTIRRFTARHPSEPGCGATREPRGAHTISLTPFDWTAAPFAELQALPRDGSPLSCETNDRNEEWTDVVTGIRRSVDTLAGRARVR